MKRFITNIAKQLIAKMFHAGQRLGFDILPRHFYSEIPDIRKLKQTRSWRTAFSMIGVNGADVDKQLEFVRSVVTEQVRAHLGSADVHSTACRMNGEAGFGPIEAEFLFAFIYTARPRRIVQIGCGVSTAVCLLAAREASYSLDITCIDPFPTQFLIEQQYLGHLTLIAQPVQELGPAIVEPLQSGDLFFVDSTHTLGPAGEVTRIILELLPRLKRGVKAHFHDIYFPYDYSPDLLSGLFFSHESPLLHAFLTMNSEYQILASLSMLHYAASKELASVLPGYRPCTNEDGLWISSGHFPSSLYLGSSEPSQPQSAERPGEKPVPL